MNGPMPQLPSLTTRDLNGDVKTLPDGRLNVLIVAYQRPQQREVDSWIPSLEALELEVPGLRYYELPVVGAMNPIGRRSLDFWMRQGIPDREARARTLTFDVDRHRFKAPLGIAGESQIAVILIDGGGTVLWRGIGAHTTAAASALRWASLAAAAPAIAH